jgi:hypothetical protein
VSEAAGRLLVRPWKLTATSLAVGDGRIAVVKPGSDPSTATMQLFGLAGY